MCNRGNYVNFAEQEQTASANVVTPGGSGGSEYSAEVEQEAKPSLTLDVYGYSYCSNYSGPIPSS